MRPFFRDFRARCSFGAELVEVLGHTSASRPSDRPGTIPGRNARVGVPEPPSIVVDLETGPEVTCDLSIEEISGTEPDAVAGLLFGSDAYGKALAALVARQTATWNRPDGWWVAAADPDAAQHAHTATYPRPEMRRASAFTDGATRPVDQMRCYDWPEYLDLLDKLGPVGLIEHVRTIEQADPDGARHLRTKHHDDATAAQFERH